MHCMKRMIMASGLACVMSGTVGASDVVTYVYGDAQGSVLATADSQGNVLTRSGFRAYGTRIIGLAANGPGFVGGREDDTGFDYIGGRFYDPSAGVFLTLPTQPLAVDARYTAYGFAYGNPYSMQRGDTGTAAR
jgi:RHS repeat-associated protein